MSDSNTNATVTLQVNGRQAEETLVNLKKHALDLTEQIAKAAAAGDKVTLKKLQRELKETTKHIKQIESSAMQVDNVLRRLDKATPTELQKTLRTLNKQLENMERGSSAWDAQVRKIKAVKDEIDKVNKELAKSQTFLERVNNKWQEWQTVAVGAVGAATGIVMAGKAAVRTYAEMDQEMASVRKYTGMTAEEVEHMNEAFKKLDTRTSREDLNKLAQEAGRLGKSSEEDVLGFVRAANQINVALDDLGDGATLTLSKLTSIFGDEERLGTEKSLLAVGSVINELSQNCTASAPYLANFAQRIAGVANTAEMSIPQIMSFAAVLDANGQACEMSASNLGKLIMMLYKDPGKIAAQVGMNVDQFTAALKRSTNEGVLMFLDHIHAMGSDEGLLKLAPLFKDLGMDSVRLSQVLSTLANNTDMLRWELGEAQTAFEEATSVTTEYNVQNTTVQAGLEKAKKGFKEMAITLGKELMPALRHIISSTSATMRVMLKTIQFVKEHKVAILSLTAGIVAYTVAVKLAVIKEALHNALIATKTALLHVHKVAVLLASAAYAKLTGNTIRANAAMKLLNTTMMANPWGLLAAAVVAVGTALFLFSKRQKEAQDATKKLTAEQQRELKVKEALADIDKRTESEYAKQAAEVVKLSRAVENNALSLKQRKAALERLKEIVPDYHADLTEEGELINNNREALDKYLDSLKASIRAKMNQEKLEETVTQQIPIEDKMRKLEGENEKLQGVLSDIRRSMENAQGAEKAKFEQDARQMTSIMGKNSQRLRSLKKQWQDLQAVIDGVAASAGTTTPTGGDTPVTPTPTDEPATSKNKFQAEDDYKERENALNRIAYAKGESDYEAYTKRMLEIEVEYHKRKLAHTDLVGNEQVTIEAAYQEALRKQKDNATKGTIEQENEEYRKLQGILQQKYVDGEISARQYQYDMELLELEHLRKVANLYQEGTKERLKAEKQYHDTSLKYQMKHVQEDKRLQEQFRQQYFDKAYRTEDKEGYKTDLQNLQLVHAQMLTAAGNNKAARLKIDRAYYEARYQLARKYNVKEAKEMTNAWRSGIDDSIEWLNSDGGQAFTESFSTIVNGMSAIFSELSNIVQAECDIQTAKIEAKYDAEIAAAEGNKSKTIDLERQKEAAIAKEKKAANKKMFAMQVIQAVAQTAMSAISAYSSAAAIPVVGFVMAPIAAAMAIAAGALQIASIKKQQQASEATGYFKGGFTPKGDKYQEVGVVHAGEWVASQELLANPTARAMIDTLDYAQRTNTIGSIKAADVSKTITAPAVLAGTASNGELENTLLRSTVVMQEYAQSMKDLNARLNEPFVTVNTVTGDSGIKKAQEEYEQLIRNKTPKSRR